MNNLRRELRREIRNNRYEKTDSGIFLPRSGVGISGLVEVSVNDGPTERFSNLVVNQGLDYILGVALDKDTTSKETLFYVTCHTGTTAPAATWTAATYDTLATEISATDVDEATRPAWVEANVSSQQIDNYASKAVFTVAAATLSLWGVAILTNSTFQGPDGLLIGATKFSAVRNLIVGDTFNVGYRFSITSTV